MAKLKLAIDLGTHTTKLLVQKQYYRSTAFVAAKKVRTPPGSLQDGEVRDFDSLSKMIKELAVPYLKKAGIIFTLTVPSLIYRHIFLPPAKKSQMRGLIELQLERLLSDQLKNYVVQYRLSGYIIDEGKNKAAVVVYAIPRKIVDGLIQLSERAGLDPYILDVQPNCVSKLQESKIYDSDKPGAASLAFIDLGFSATNIHIVEGGSTSFTKVIPLGGKIIDEAIKSYYNVSPQEAERIKMMHTDLITGFDEPTAVSGLIRDALSPLVLELQRILRFINLRKNNTQINQVFLYGGAAHLKNLDQFLEESLNLNVSIVKSMENIALKHNLQEFDRMDFFNCIGALKRKTPV